MIRAARKVLRAIRLGLALLLVLFAYLVAGGEIMRDPD